MSSEDINYYRQRARVERSRAKEAPTPEIASVHERLADLYEKLIRTSTYLVANDFSEQLLHNDPPTQQDTLQ
jgi:hypothetical protein